MFRFLRFSKASAGRAEGTSESEDADGSGQSSHLVFDPGRAVEEGHHQNWAHSWEEGSVS